MYIHQGLGPFHYQCPNKYSFKSKQYALSIIYTFTIDWVVEIARSQTTPYGIVN